MRTLLSQNLVRDEDTTLFPQGAIINETDTNEGTPVVREVYNDVLMNMYALVKDSGINFSFLEDNEVNGYQILAALKRVYNEFVDQYKVLTKQGNGTWLLDLNFSLIPKKTVFFVRVTDEIESDVSTILQGQNFAQYTLKTKTKLKTGDDCILVFDENDSRIFSLNQGGSGKSINTSSIPLLGNPIQDIANPEKIWYFYDGILSSLFPEFYDIKLLISAHFGVDMAVKSVIQYNSYFIVLSYDDSTLKYHLGYFIENQFNNYIEIGFNNGDMSSNPTSDLNLMMFKGKENQIFISNQNGNSNFDNIFSAFEFNQSTNTMVFIQDYNLDDSLVKNNNFAWSENILSLIVFEDAIIKQYSLDGSVIEYNHYNQLVGQALNIDGKVYISNNNNAFLLQKWN